MNKEQKAAAVEEIGSELSAADAIFAIDYRGIDVAQIAALRARLRDADASFRIVKNTLTRRAVEQSGTEPIRDSLQGPTALALVHGDVAQAAKAINDFRREHDLLDFKAGIMEGEALEAEQFTAIARLPARDVLYGQFVGTIASPLTGLVRGLGSMVQGLAVQLSQIAEQGLVSGEAPSPPEDSEAPAEEQASDEQEAPAGAKAAADGEEAAGEEDAAEETPAEAEAEGSGDKKTDDDNASGDADTGDAETDEEE